MSKKKIYTIANSHLDTVWCWDFETTVKKFIPSTLDENFALFEKYPTTVSALKVLTVTSLSKNITPKSGKSSKNI